MYDAGKEEAKDECQTVGSLVEALEDGDELIKCGSCYDDSNIYSRINDAIECTVRNPPCKGNNDENYKYPICIWDAGREEKKDKCVKLSKIEEYLVDGGVDDGDILLDCGSCDDLNLFAPYWEPPFVL